MDGSPILIKDALEMGWSLHRAGELDGAGDIYCKILRHADIHEVDALYLMSTIFHARGRIEAARVGYRNVLEFDPGYSGGYVADLLGNMADDIPGPMVPRHDWPWKHEESSSIFYHRPFWSGGMLDGRIILLRDNVGLGDEFQFIRYADLVKGRGAEEVIVACRRPLARLLATCPGVDRTIPQGDPLPDFDVYSDLFSLGDIFGLFTPHGAYLSADPVRVEHWRDRIDAIPAFLRVGVAWQGDPTHPRDPYRSFPLSRFAPLAAIDGVRLFSLQKGCGVEQIRSCGFPVEDFGDDADPGMATYDDAAAIMSCMDLVVAPDTSIAHAAGALGVPAWIAVTHNLEYRWGIESPSPAWYPTSSIFRQESTGDWSGVFEDITVALDRLVSASSSTG